MHQIFAKQINGIILTIIFSNHLCAMESIDLQEIKARLFGLFSEHKIASIGCTTAIASAAVAGYALYNREPVQQQSLSINSKNPIIHLHDIKSNIQNINATNMFLNETVHDYSLADIEEISINEFISKGRIFLVKNKKKKHALAITLVKIARSQEDFDCLETALRLQEKCLSIYSKYKSDHTERAIVDCFIEYSKNTEIKIVDA